MNYGKDTNLVGVNPINHPERMHEEFADILTTVFRYDRTRFRMGGKLTPAQQKTVVNRVRVTFRAISNVIVNRQGVL